MPVLIGIGAAFGGMDKHFFDALSETDIESEILSQTYEARSQSKYPQQFG